MSLRKNILANYASQGYVTLIGIVMVPLYVKHMGAEAYGLVGFFTMMQAWFQLLDLGLTPTMARATAQYRGGALDPSGLRRLLRVLEGIFIIVAFVAGALVITFSDKIASDWLKVQNLPLEEVRHAIMIMGIIVACRWISGLYRGAINGFEKMVWLSGFNISVATARFVLVVPIFIFVGTGPATFFLYQLIVAILELTVLVAKLYRLLPGDELHDGSAWDWQPLKKVLKFSLSIAFTSSIWVMVSQTDKLVLSKLLPLADYAYFTLAVLVAGGVSVVSGPVSTALLPRLTRIATEGDETAFVELYRMTTQLIGVVTLPAAVVVALFAEPLLWAWSGDGAVAHSAAPILVLYALGNGILALAAFPYYLQYAKGDLRLHLIGNLLFVILLIPALVVSTMKFGAIGAGYAWVAANFVYFVFWIPVIHKKFIPGVHLGWLGRDIVRPFATMLPLALILKHSINMPHERVPLLIYLFLIGIVLVGVSVSSSNLLRSRIKNRFVLKVEAQ